MLQDRKHRKPGGPGEAVTQLRYAREGVVTEEMRYVADRERMEPETAGKRSRAGA